MGSLTIGENTGEMTMEMTIRDFSFTHDIHHEEYKINHEDMIEPCVDSSDMKMELPNREEMEISVRETIKELASPLEIEKGGEEKAIDFIEEGSLFVVGYSE